MPDLPTLTVTDDQMNYILEAFKDYYGTQTSAETATAYKRHLARMVIDVVKGYQIGSITRVRNQEIDAKIAQVEAFFPDPDSIT